MFSAGEANPHLAGFLVRLEDIWEMYRMLLYLTAFHRMPRWLKFNPQRLPEAPRSSCFQERTCVSTTSPLKTKVCEIEEWGCWEHLERTKGSVSKPKWNTAGLQLCYLLHRTRSQVTKQNEAFCDRLRDVKEFSASPAGHQLLASCILFWPTHARCRYWGAAHQRDALLQVYMIHLSALLCSLCVCGSWQGETSGVPSHTDTGSLVHHCVCQAHWPPILLCRLSPHHRNTEMTDTCCCVCSRTGSGPHACFGKRVSHHLPWRFCFCFLVLVCVCFQLFTLWRHPNSFIIAG